MGGDFYDVIPLPDGRVGFVIGDVTDKGVPAALVMSATRSVLRASAQRLIEPGEVLERVNEHLCPDMPEKMFVTCLYGVLDTESGLFRFANAGHDLPYVQTADGVVELRARGMPLGLMPGMSYEEKEATLQPGDSVLLHSDGVLEAHDPEREMFGSPRLKETMARAPGGREMMDHVLSDLAAFTGPDAEQEDDITMVTLQRSAGASTASAESNGRVLAEFELASAPGNEREAIALVEGAVAGLGLEPAPSRAAQDRGGRGDDERDGARQRVPGRPPGVDPRDPHPGAVERACHRLGGRRRGSFAGEAGPGGEARRPPEAARLGPAPDREDGRRDARDERGGQTHRRARPAPGRRRT